MKAFPSAPILVLVSILLLGGCLQVTGESLLPFRVIVDGQSIDAQAPEGSSVAAALSIADVTLGDLDRIDPPAFSPLEPNSVITITRVREETVIIEEVLPFNRQTTINEAMPASESHLLQAGVNGVAEVTYRIIYENSVEVSRGEIRRIVVIEPQDEIIMTGSQNMLQTVTVRGTLVYISRGNIWRMSGNSLTRRPLTLDGGVDGRVLSISPDGKSLLFTVQMADAPGEDFNQLYLIQDISREGSEPIKTELKNILWAQWVPGEDDRFAYSTAEPRPDFPGWQANNDVWMAEITSAGYLRDETSLVESSSGGIYGWFGTFYSFGLSANLLAWARSDGAGIMVPIYDERDERVIEAYYPDTLISFEPKNPYDFVWVPDFSLSPDGQYLAVITHGSPLGSESPADSEVYDLIITPVNGGYSILFADQVGMFSAPRFSPLIEASEGVFDYRIAYLVADKPLNSQTSQYRLVTADRDGSERRLLFPPVSQPGLRPSDQDFVWSPYGGQIALTYLGSLYLVDTQTGYAQQLSQDGETSHPVWLP